jgi:hypothetical protein
MLREGMQQGCDEHVAGDAAHGIQMYMQTYLSFTEPLARA